MRRVSSCASFYNRAAPAATPGEALRRRSCDGFALFYYINAPEFRGLRSGIWSIVREAGGDRKSIASFELARRLAVDQQFAFAFNDVTDFIAGMGVASGPPSGGNLDLRDHSFAAGHGYVPFVYDGAFYCRILCGDDADD